MRLQKFMADAGVASRRACEEYIRAGEVQVNGVVAEIGCVVDPAHDMVLFRGEPVVLEAQRVVVLFYKPRGVVCTSNDPEGRKTVQEYFSDFPERLYNVGRLDINSEGLLVMTNDGALMQRLTHPRYKIKKTYYAVCDGTLTREEAARLQTGVELNDGMTAPAVVAKVRPTKTGETSFLISIREGRNRQVRRMIEAVGHQTLRLKREQIGELKLQQLRPGAWRYPDEKEQAWMERILLDDKL
ncbi:rRNA pseudouridine synthase [Christensenellaceae bacterium OttesenSCG-928-L17]|nr:rRNA pseudouridine synthase [Christensenellaceae bacterium OttesenSCG-928-L17]